MMERLTRPCEDTNDGEYIDYTAGTFMGIFPCCTLGKVVDRLAYHEDMEEQGRLVVLPCKVGDTLFDIYEAQANGGDEIRALKVTDIHVHLDKRNKAWLIVGGYYFAVADFGKTVFLTREDAERALKEGADHE